MSSCRTISSSFFVGFLLKIINQNKRANKTKADLDGKSPPKKQHRNTIVHESIHLFNTPFLRKIILPQKDLEISDQ